MTLGFHEYASVSVRYSRRDTRLLNGSLTTPVNDQDVLEVTVGADLPLASSWTVGAEYQYRDRQEDISPSVSDIFSIRASTTLWNATKLYISGGILKVNLERSEEDIDQIQLRVGLSGRPLSRVHMAYDVSFLRDAGGSLRREQFKHRLNFQWHYRAVRFFLRAEIGDESLGPTSRVYKRVTAEVTRMF